MLKCEIDIYSTSQGLNSGKGENSTEIQSKFQIDHKFLILKMFPKLKVGIENSQLKLKRLK